MSIEAMKLALEAWDTGLDKRPAMEALRTTIAEAEKQEPVAWLYRDSWGTLKLSQIMPPPIGAFPVYTTPPAAQRQWVGLTERETELLDGMIAVQLDHAARCDGIANRTMAEKQKGWDMERVALLQKLKEKNT